MVPGTNRSKYKFVSARVVVVVNFLQFLYFYAFILTGAAVRLFIRAVHGSIELSETMEP
jgi:hypothetical protein